MAASDLAAVDAVMAAVQSVPDVGRVWAHNIYIRDAGPDLVVDDTGRWRSWWIVGPTMRGTRATQSVGGAIERRWVFRIQGLYGASDGGAEIVEMRATALAISDALDASPDLSGAVHQAEPVVWSVGPEHRLWRGKAVAFAELQLTVVTLSTP